MALASLVSASRSRPAPLARATSVPFEGASLLGARVRPDERHDLAALLHDFSGSGSVYVLPWKALPDTLPMTPLDQSLHAVIGRERAVTPSSVRRAFRQVAAGGLAGEPARLLEAERQVDDEERGGVVLARLLADFLRSAGLTGQALDPGRGRKSMLEAACLDAGIRPDSLIRALEECAAVIQPAGLPDDAGGAYFGPLRVLCDEMRRFARHLRHRSDADARQRAHLLPVIGAVDRAIGLAGAALSDIDLLLGQFLKLLAHWEGGRATLVERVDRLSWAVDGWEDVIAYHLGLRAGPERSEAERPAFLAAIVQDLAGSG